MDRPVALSRSRGRERRLNNQILSYCSHSSISFGLSPIMFITVYSYRIPLGHYPFVETDFDFVLNRDSVLMCT